MSEKNDTTFFALSSDTKKKPMNLIMGSTFNYKATDFFEFEVTNFIPIEFFAKKVEVDSYMKPVVVFQGDIFETDFQYERIKKFFLDFFRIKNLDEVVISELRKVIVISAGDDKEIKIRTFQIDANMNQYNVNFIFYYYLFRFKLNSKHLFED
jgi:ribosome production factor 2